MLSHWFLHVNGTDGGISVQQAGSPPAEISISIPWSMISRPLGDTLFVSLRTNERREFATPGGDYLLHAFLDVETRWTVRIAGVRES